MIMLYLLLYLLFLHFVGDFILQNDWMATNKSRDIWALMAHVEFYYLTFVLGLLPALVLNTDFLPTASSIFQFVVVNTAIHGVVDYFTSRASSYFYSKNNRHNFFVVIGFDQFIHTATIILTMQYFLLEYVK